MADEAKECDDLPPDRLRRAAAMALITDISMKLLGAMLNPEIAEDDEYHIMSRDEHALRGLWAQASWLPTVRVAVLRRKSIAWPPELVDDLRALAAKLADI